MPLLILRSVAIRKSCVVQLSPGVPSVHPSLAAQHHISACNTTHLLPNTTMGDTSVKIVIVVPQGNWFRGMWWWSSPLPVYDTYRFIRVWSEIPLDQSFEGSGQGQTICWVYSSHLPGERYKRETRYWWDVVTRHLKTVQYKRTFHINPHTGETSRNLQWESTTYYQRGVSWYGNVWLTNCEMVCELVPINMQDKMQRV